MKKTKFLQEIKTVIQKNNGDKCDVHIPKVGVVPYAIWIDIVYI